MKFQQTFTRAGIRYFLLAIVFGLLNCNVDYIGTTVPENQRIPLQKGGRQAAVSSAFEYTMDFNYVFYQEDIEHLRDLKKKIKTDKNDDQTNGHLYIGEMENLDDVNWKKYSEEFFEK